MAVAQSNPPAQSKPLRLWPGVTLGTLLALLWFVAPRVLPGDIGMYAVFGGLGCALAVVLWWLFFSRAPWLERVGVILFAALALIATKLVVHPSIAGGAMGMLVPVFGTPVLCLALVAGALIGRRLSTGLRAATIGAGILIVCGVFTLIRTGGMSGGGHFDLHWRWTPTPEDRLLAQAAAEKDPLPPPTPSPTAPPMVASSTTPAASPTAAPVTPAPAPAAPTAATAGATKKPETMTAAATTGTGEAEWPGFRGPGRDDVVRGVRIDTDWAKSPPVEIWRRPIGPGWSSFSVHGNRIYTQEQRGEDEIVACYDLRRARRCGATATARGSGSRTRAPVRAPRRRSATAASTRSARRASSTRSTRTAAPSCGRATRRRIRALPLRPGDSPAPRSSSATWSWSPRPGGSPATMPRPASRAGSLRLADRGYSSPQLATIAGVTQVLFLSGAGATSLSPADGAVLWKNAWNSDGILQPFVLDGRDVLVGSGSGMAETGIRRLHVTQAPGGWTVEERWTSRGLKPYLQRFRRPQGARLRLRRQHPLVHRPG